jgi:predicted nuclease of predicted toxin-antitoxin system
VKLKLDENLPGTLVQALERLGHDVDTVLGEGLRGEDDPRVWGAAQVAGRFLITQDLDFSDLRAFAPGTHAGLLLVRLENPGRAALSHRVMELFRTEPADSWLGCEVIASDLKVRIKRPGARSTLTPPRLRQAGGGAPDQTAGRRGHGADRPAAGGSLGHPHGAETRSIPGG